MKASKAEILLAKIKLIPTDHFYTKGSIEVDLEGYAEEETFIIPMHYQQLRTEYYGENCCEHIREYDEWKDDQRWIKDYFIDHLLDIETLGK